MEIILLRHGRPKVELGGWLSAKKLKLLVEEYAASGIQDEPPEHLTKRFNDYVSICSDLSRSNESAIKLCLKNIVLSDKLFKETDIPHFDKSFIKLPVSLWLILLRIMWLFGFSKNGESFTQAKRRSQRASKKLIMLAEKHGKIILVGHGLMNRLIGKELIKRSWITAENEGKSYWEYCSYTRSS